MINTQTMKMEVKTTIDIDVESITRQLLSANMMRMAFDSRWKNSPQGFGELKVQVGCGRQACHTRTAAKLVLDGCEYTNIMGETCVAKGMYINIGKIQYAKLFRDMMSEIEGDWIQRDPEDQPLMIEQFKREPFRGKTFDCDFIVLDQGMWGMRTDTNPYDFVGALMARVYEGHFPNLKSILIMQ